MAAKNCEFCGKRYERPPSQLGRFCSKRCAYDALVKEVTTVRRMVIAPTHPLAPPSGLVLASRMTLYEKVGPGRHPCYWCGEPVTWAVGERGNVKGNLIADHLNANPLDDRPSNLVPACATCNSVRSRAVGDDEHYVTRKNGSRLRGEQRTCEGCGATFVAMPDPRPGRGRFCSRSCARRQPHKC